MKRTILRKAWNIIFLLLVAATVIVTGCYFASEKAYLEQGIAETGDIQYKLPYAFLLPFTAIFLTIALAEETVLYLSVRYFLKDNIYKTTGKTVFYTILLSVTLVLVGIELSKVLSLDLILLIPFSIVGIVFGVKAIRSDGPRKRSVIFCIIAGICVCVCTFLATRWLLEIIR